MYYIYSRNRVDKNDKGSVIGSFNTREEAQEYLRKVTEAKFNLYEFWIDELKELEEYDGLEETNAFSPVNLSIGRAKALAELLMSCKYLGVGVKAVKYYLRGFLVEFEGYEGNAVLHDGSYGRQSFMWETIDFPWDGDDVSVHTSHQLAHMLCALNKGEPWEPYAEMDE